MSPGPAPSSTSASNLAEIRIRRGWGMRELARRSRVAKGAIHNIEHRKVVPEERTLLKLANALGCSREWLAQDQPYLEKCSCCQGRGNVVVWPEKVNAL